MNNNNNYYIFHILTFIICIYNTEIKVPSPVVVTLELLFVEVSPERVQPHLLSMNVLLRN